MREGYSEGCETEREGKRHSAMVGERYDRREGGTMYDEGKKSRMDGGKVGSVGCSQSNLDCLSCSIKFHTQVCLAQPAYLTILGQSRKEIESIS